MSLNVFRRLRRIAAVAVASAVAVALAVGIGVCGSAAADDKEKPAAAGEDFSGDKKAVKTGSPLAFKVKDIDDKEVDLSSYKGKVLLVTNVASKCGLTDKQYASLTALHKKYKDQGFEILAFPANNFGKQEPAPNPEIKEFCSKKGVDFKLFSKISVKGDDIHPLYKFLTTKETNPEFAGDIKWNFDKFLVDRSGQVIGRFEPRVDPLSKDVTEPLEKALKASAPKDKASK
ncbi:MAG TPA: glutathione peroxidase [Planctomycetota bacterium]|nr:glutathione peroxidase [Planctomycetota bacterium]